MAKYAELNQGEIEAIVDKLGGMEGVKNFLSGKMELKFLEHIIDCDKDPLIPHDGWKVEQHIKGGQFTWNPEKVKLFLSEKQKDGKSIEGNKLRKELESKPVMNANLLDYLLDHPDLIPEEWKGKVVFFWGTIYRNSGGNLRVRYLIFGEGRWGQGLIWLGHGFRGGYPAVVSAS